MGHGNSRWSRPHARRLYCSASCGSIEKLLKNDARVADKNRQLIEIDAWIFVKDESIVKKQTSLMVASHRLNRINGSRWWGFTMSLIRNVWFLRETRLRAAPRHKISIAVVVHAFYPEIFSDICRLLRNVPEGFSLFIGVPSHADKLTILKSLKNAGINAQLSCKIVPNRGRNFSTLFVRFPQEIKKHDLVLHLHTKKSLFTGREQREWRDAIFNGLLGSKLLVKNILQAFQDDPQLGLFYPAAPKMPYWAYHWLSNVPFGLKISNRLKIKRSEDFGYLDYPVGGMFWARTDAVRPLLDMQLKYSDFPVEAGQTDGTLHHAMERLVGVVAREEGFSFIEYGDHNGALKRNFSTKNSTQYINRSISQFVDFLRSVEVVSFDIFDTILTRRSISPDSVLRYVGHRIAKKHPNANDYFERRKAAEDLARSSKNHAGDVDLEEIYGAFRNSPNWPLELVKEAAALERKIDADSICMRTDMIKLLVAAQAAGKRIIAISDTYYTMKDIETLLTKHEVLNFFDEIYISSKEQARKDRGDLWAKVIGRETVSCEQWLHVGDNEQSDIQAACDRKLHFFHVMSPRNILEFDGFRRSSESDNRRWPADLILGPAVLRLASSPFLTGRTWGQQSLSQPRDIGYIVFGPIVFAFIAWVIRHPTMQSLEHLYFFAREGHLLHHIYSLIYERYPELNLPPSTYFYCSRRSSLAAAQGTKFSPDKIIAGWGFQGTLRELLRVRIGFEMGDTPLADRAIQLPNDADEVKSHIEKLRSSIIAHGTSELKLFLDYAHNEGMREGGNFGLVDIGYSASIQLNLQNILEIPFQGFYLASFDNARQVKDAGGRAFGCFAEDVPSWSVECAVLKYSLMLEAFLSAPHGQVLRFSKDPDGAFVAPVFRADPRSREELLILSDLHDGARDYVNDLMDIYGVDLLLADGEKTTIQEPLRMLMQGIIEIPHHLRKFFKVEDEYCGNGDIKIFSPAERVHFIHGRKES